MGCTTRSAEDEIFVRDPRVAVVGVGGAGVNCVDRLLSLGFRGAETMSINTDVRCLHGKRADRKLLLGRHRLQGQGTGGDPTLGEECAHTSIQDLRESLWDKDLVFVILGLGGGTGTGASQVVVEVVRERGSIVVPICTLPFRSEGKERFARSIAGLKRLYETANSVIVLDNNRLLKIAPALPVCEAFNLMDQVISDSIMSILSTFQNASYVNIDFSDVKNILADGGEATIIYGESASSHPEMVVNDALRSPFLNVDYAGARGALIHITGSCGLSIGAMDSIASGIVSHLADNARVKVGIAFSEEYEGRVRVMGVLTNIRSEYIQAGGHHDGVRGACPGYAEEALIPPSRDLWDRV